MTFYICSCGTLFGEQKEAFNQYCKLKGHTLFEVNAELYRLVYSIQENNLCLKETVRKRNRNISVLKERISELKNELSVLKKP